MTETYIEIKFTPPDLPQRLSGYSRQLDKEAAHTMKQALYHAQGSVPAYPPAVPESRYVRTYTLGRSVGLGGSGQAQIFEVKKLGSASYEGRLGTRVIYAQYVIGENQRPLFKGRGWWTMKTVAERASKGITRLYEQMLDRLAKWIEGR